MSAARWSAGYQLKAVNPNWPAPASVFACTTTRDRDPNATSFELSPKSPEPTSVVETNQEALRSGLRLPSRPVFLSQQHGRRVVEASVESMGVEADACFTRQPRVVCGILTADCVPALFCSADGRCVAAAHAGWRGLASGILEATVEALAVPGPELLVWLGPAIGPDAFEVGEDVRARFCALDRSAMAAFRQKRRGKWLADLYLLCRRRLASVGVDAVFGGDFCTYTDERFYSHRREGTTARMASLIWRE